MAKAYSNRGDAYSVLGQHQRAIQDYQEAIRLDSQDGPRVYYNRGGAYLNLGQYGQAIEDLDEFIRLDSHLALAYANRALAHIVLGGDAEAQQDVDRAAELGLDRALLQEMVEQAKQLRQA